MKNNSANKAKRVKFKIVKQNENPTLQAINILFISGYCILTIASVYYFINTHSIKTVIFFAVFFLLLTFLMEIINEYLNIEHVELRIINSSFIMTRGNKVEKFNVNGCKIKYHQDRTDWVELNCENQNFNFSLAQHQTSDLRKFIEQFLEK